MILVLGGAYQGKEAFVMKELIKDEYVCIEYLSQLSLKDNLKGTVIIKSIEKSVRTKSDFDKYKRVIHQLKVIEEENKINVILIGEHIGSGIVPIEVADRIWRDTVGFFYQFLVKQCDQVYRVWAGIGEQLKG